MNGFDFDELTSSEIVESAVKQFLSENRVAGDVISHEWLQMYLQIPTPKTVAEAKEVQWITLKRVDEFRDVLLYTHKIAMENIYKVGYRLVPPSEQAEYAVRKAARHIKKGIDDAIDLLDNTRMDELELDHKKRHIDAHVKMMGLQSLMDKEKREVFTLFNKQQIKKSA